MLFEEELHCLHVLGVGLDAHDFVDGADEESPVGSVTVDALELEVFAVDGADESDFECVGFVVHANQFFSVEALVQDLADSFEKSGHWRSVVLPFNGGLALVGGLEPFVADGFEGVDDGVGEAEVEVLGGGVGADDGFDSCGFGGSESVF